MADGDGATLRMLQLSAVLAAFSFGVFALYGIFAAAVRDHLLARPRVIDRARRAFGATFIALAVKLACTDR